MIVEDYTQYAIYCNQRGERHIERQYDAYLVVANPITSQITITTGTSYDRMTNFGNFTLNAGVNLTKTTSGSPLIIRCAGICTINGTINLAGKGIAIGGKDQIVMAKGTQTQFKILLLVVVPLEVITATREAPVEVVVVRFS